MMAIMIYGINSSGKNQVFGFGFVSSKDEDEEDFHFLLHHFAEYMEKPPKMIMISRQVASSIVSENLHTALLKVYGK